MIFSFTATAGDAATLIARFEPAPQFQLPPEDSSQWHAV